jgi:hypothetical protein
MGPVQQWRRCRSAWELNFDGVGDKAGNGYPSRSGYDNRVFRPFTHPLQEGIPVGHQPWLADPQRTFVCSRPLRIKHRWTGV